MLFRTNALDDRVRRTLVDNLYANPGSLTAGAANGIIAALVAAAYAGNDLIWQVALLLSFIGVTRVVMAVGLPRLKVRDTKRLELLYELGAFSYTATVGIFTALTIWLNIPLVAQMLMACYAIGYAGGMATRNAGRPLILVTGMVLTFAPICIALWQSGDTAARTLAAAIVICFAGMVSISLQIFRTIRDFIAAAETSARLADKMQHLARTDVVTGLHNRAGLNHYLVEHLSRPREAPKLALFWCDLDRFKEVNDVLGHQVGDRVLTEVAQRLRSQAKGDAVIGRFGGDEFIMACDVKDRREVETIALAVLGEITRPMRLENDRLEISCSMGVALMPDDGEDLESVMLGADLALIMPRSTAGTR